MHLLWKLVWKTTFSWYMHTHIVLRQNHQSKFWKKKNTYLKSNVILSWIHILVDNSSWQLNLIYLRQIYMDICIWLLIVIPIVGRGCVKLAHPKWFLQNTTTSIIPKKLVLIYFKLLHQQTFNLKEKCVINSLLVLDIEIIIS